MGRCARPIIELHASKARGSQMEEMTMRTHSTGQFVTDSWLAGIPAMEVATLLASEGRPGETIAEALELYEALDHWSQASLERLAASCSDWREF